MPNKATLKNILVKTVVVSLVICAIIGIFVMLTQSFGEIQARILGSTLTVGVFSITSLANIRNLESEHASYRNFAKLSILFSLAAMLLILSFIWISIEHTPWKPTLVFSILAVSTAHASLLLPSRSKSTLLDAAVTTTLASIAFVAGFLIYLVVAEANGINDIFYRLLGVFAILDVLGTIVTPILAHMSKKSATPIQNSSTIPILAAPPTNTSSSTNKTASPPSTTPTE